MQIHTAKNALLFLQRVQLSGQEVSAFIDVVRAIECYVAPQDAPQKSQESSETPGDLGLRAGNW